MARNPHTQGSHTTWTFEFGGISHRVELEESYNTESWIVWLDGEMISGPAQRVDSGFVFRAGDAACIIEPDEDRFSLLVEGSLIPADSERRDTLLRPASAPRNPGELLRPAGSSPSEKPDSLLRPSEAD